jgi:hydroxymethylglutaryl-CoA reductase
MNKSTEAIGGISGYSKLTRKQRIDLLYKIVEHSDLNNWLDSWLHADEGHRKTFENLIENFITTFHLPMGLVPNMLINGKHYLVPMVIEESSVIAAASKAAKFWSALGGFRVEILGTERKGQIHFLWTGSPKWLQNQFPLISMKMREATKHHTHKMEQRGGGITHIRLINKTLEIPGYFQVDVSFETADAMGANFINSCLEEMADVLKNEFATPSDPGTAEIIMSILSNYTPESLVRCTVECDIQSLEKLSITTSPYVYARKFELANQIAIADISRAVTHNKGIYNGVDAVVLATGNDWRAAEACGHAYASASGHYRALTDVEIKGNTFRNTLTLPIALGTVGGLTRNHPLAKFALEILGNPGSAELMKISAAAGMANNFSAIHALITSGIQQGHMKMHLPNILSQLGATQIEAEAAILYFSHNPVTFAAVDKYLQQLRKQDEHDPS